MEGFIEILPGIFYEVATGLPWSTKRNLGRRGGFSTDGKLKQLTGKNSRGYYLVRIEDKMKSWHRIIWEFFNEPIPEEFEVDHINNNRLDNRIENLQLLSHKDNCRSCLKFKNNESGYPGVSWHKGKQKWQAQIQINGKSKFLGYFNDKLEAAEAYRKAKIKYHGIDSIRF